MKIVFDKTLTGEVLKSFNKIADKEDYIVDQNTGQRVLSEDGEEIRVEEFAGIVPGSEIYLKSDIISLIKYVERKHDQE